MKKGRPKEPFNVSFIKKRKEKKKLEKTQVRRTEGESLGDRLP